MAFGLGIGKALSVDDSTSVGLTIGAAILSMGVGYAFDRFVTTPYITRFLKKTSTTTEILLMT